MMVLTSPRTDFDLNPPNFLLWELVAASGADLYECVPFASAATGPDHLAGVQWVLAAQ